MATPDASYLQALKNNRLLTHVVLGLLALAGLLAVAVVSLFPLKTKEFVVYEFVTGGNNFVRIHRADGELKARPLLLGHFLRYYVQNREPINKVDEADRYQRVKAMSSEKVFSIFRTNYGGKESPLRREGFKRTIVITRDVPVDQGIHQVEFKTVDTTDGSAGERVAEWVANIQYSFESREASYDERYFNPLGLVVMEYTLSVRSQQ